MAVMAVIAVIAAIAALQGASVYSGKKHYGVMQRLKARGMAGSD